MSLRVVFNAFFKVGELQTGQKQVLFPNHQIFLKINFEYWFYKSVERDPTRPDKAVEIALFQ